jgi:sulfatase maturation enzyme AslB (radical SAM superfamily)
MKTLQTSERKESDLKKSLKRHIGFFVKYLTIMKAINLAVSLFEMKLKITKVHSYPSYLRVEVSAVCNLKCPGCILSVKHNISGEDIKIDKPFMSFEEFKANIQDFLPYLLKVNLYDEGEPYLNKEINKIVRYLNDNKVATCISTNFSIKFNDEALLDIVNSGLDHLIVAVDGIDQKTYSEYRVGGNFDLVINNIKRLSKLIKDLKSRLKIEFQFLDFNDSAEMRQKAKQLAEDLGVWRFNVIRDVSRGGLLEQKFTGTKEERMKAGCYQIWLSGSITSTGNFYACDYGEDSGFEALGSAAKYSSQNLMNHNDIKELRQGFSDVSQMNNVCTHCILTAKKNNSFA